MILMWLNGNKKKLRKTPKGGRRIATPPKRNNGRVAPAKAPVKPTPSDSEKSEQIQSSEDLEFQEALKALGYSPEKPKVPHAPEKPEQPQLQKKTEKNSFPRWLTIAIIIGIISTVTLILIALLILFGFDPWMLFWKQKIWLLLVYIGTTVGNAVVKQYSPKKEEIPNFTGAASTSDKAVSDGRMALPGEGLLPSAACVLKNIGTWLWRNRLVRTVTLIIILFVTSSGLSHAIYVGSAKSFAEDQEKQTGELVGNDEELPTDKSNSPEESTPAKSNNTEEIEAPIAFLQEPGRYYELTEEEECRLFFRAGDYEIAERASAGEIAEKIKPFIQQLLATQKENIFDRDAPESIKGDIANASRLEAEMENSDELDQVISVRMDVFQDYPKYRIANLLANNMQTYAKKYTEINGSYETIKYYHAYSIFWTWDSLTFASVTSYTLKDDLDYIRMRYHDIADKAIPGSMDQLRASVLSDAFKLLENMDFFGGDMADSETLPEDNETLKDNEVSEYE